ncbi:MAG: hypothetical protein KDA44_22765 [Planctomycetales bacterium]|nr:hypothetical protein [Planctomycetales bacterium]
MLLVALTATSASASVQMQFLNVSPGVGGFKMYNYKESTASVALLHNNVSAGAMNWQTGGDDATLPVLPLDGSNKLVTFCIEIGQYVTSAAKMYDKTALTSAPDPYVTGYGNSLTKISSERAGLLGNLADKYWNSALDTGVENAAFQLAVWEIVHESAAMALSSIGGIGGLNVGAGSFYVVGDRTVETDAITLANSWLAGLQNVDLDPTKSLYALTNKCYQDQIFYGSTPTPDPEGDPGTVPEPATVISWLGLMTTVGLIARRRRAAEAA